MTAVYLGKVSSRRVGVRALPETGAVALRVRGRLDATIPRLCIRLRNLLASTNAALVVCDVAALTKPNLKTLDALARLALTASRLGRRLVLCNAPTPLERLLCLTGLNEVLPVLERSSIERERQAEQREEPRRVEERRDADDLSA